MTSTSPLWQPEASLFSFLPATVGPVLGRLVTTIPDPCKWNLRLTIQTLPRWAGPVLTLTAPAAQSAAKVPGSTAGAAAANFLDVLSGRLELGSRRVLFDWYLTWR